MLPCFHFESFKVILSAAQDLVLSAQDNLRENSRLVLKSSLALQLSS